MLAKDKLPSNKLAQYIFSGHKHILYLENA